MRKFIDINCNKFNCPIYKDKQGKIAPIKTELNVEGTELSFDVDVLFIAGTPKRQDENFRIPLSTREGFFFRNYIKKKFKVDHKLAYVNITRCVPPDQYIHDNDYKREVRKICPFIEHDIKRMNPKLIVMLGDSVAQVLLTREQNLPELQHKIIKRELFGETRNILITFDPARIMNYIPGLNIFTQDVEKVHNFVRSEKYPDYSSKTDFKLLTTVQEVKEYVDYLLYETPNSAVGFDVETLNLNKKHGNRLLTLQFADTTTNGVVIPLAHRETPFLQQEQQEVLKHLQRLFTITPKFKYWVTHNGKYEQMLVMTFITDNKMFSNAPMIDTMAGMFLLNENRPVTSLKLEVLAKEFLGFDYGKMKTIRGNLNDFPLLEVAEYGSLDAVKTLSLFNIEKLYAYHQDYYKDWMKLLINIYSPSFGTLAHMERNGFYIDRDTARLVKGKQSPLLKRMFEIERELRSTDSVKQVNAMLSSSAVKVKPMFGTPEFFKLKHKDHLIKLFHDVLGLELDVTDKGNPTIGKTFYEKYGEVPEVKLIKEYADMKKIYTSYAPKLLELIEKPTLEKYDGIDGRIRPNFFITNTVTGRSSSSTPNLQQIPRAETKERAMIKNLFRAEQSNEVKAMFKSNEACTLDQNVKCLVQLDYMANEVRWWAIFSQDKALADVFVKGKALRDAYRKNPTPEMKQKAEIEGDIHRQTASRMFGIPIEKVTSKERQPSKNIVFGWMYGRSTKSIAMQLAEKQWDKENEDWDTFVDRVQGYCDAFGTAYPDAEKWLYEIEKVAQEKGYAPSLIGRRRRLEPNYISNDKQLIAGANRQARNSPIQSNASDAALVGLSLMQKYINKYNKDWKIQNAVHDSCVVEVAVAELEEYVEIAEKIFTTATMNYMKKHWNINFICPLEVEFEISQAPLHGWATVTKWDFSPEELQKIKEGCLDPKKAKAKG